MEKKRALGRGLEALIPRPVIETEMPSIVNIDILQIKPNRYQPRENFAPSLMEELKASIRKRGVIQPVVVRQIPEGYELIVGERRWRAAQELGMSQVPAIIKDIKEEAELLEMALMENLQREDLNPMEKARVFKRLQEEFELSPEKIGQMVGKEAVSVINTLRLLKLPKEVQEKIGQGELSEGHGRAILSIEEPQAQINFCQEIIRKGLSVREAEYQAKKFRAKKLDRFPKALKKDRQCLAWEEELQRVLGTKVRILPRRQGGKIEMEYYSLADLERLVGLLEKARG